MAELDLTPERNRIFRITHINNVPWILRNGVHCRSSTTVDPNFVPIGIPDLIDRRARHPVPIAPGGTLADYVPFYFTPHSIMLLNIKTGFNGVVQRPNADIVILVSSLDKLTEAGCRYLFTSGHAYMQGSDYYADKAHLDQVDWGILRRRDFKKDAIDTDKSRRYQAEALAVSHVPVPALLGVACYDQSSTNRVLADVERCGLALTVLPMPSWYF